MDELGICWGVQYELARGETRGWWGWSDVSPEKLEELRGTNALSAAKVFAVMKGGSVVHRDLKIWYASPFRFFLALRAHLAIQGGTRPGADLDH